MWAGMNPPPWSRLCLIGPIFLGFLAPAGAQPKLALARPSATSVQVIWPGEESGFQLEASTRLGAAADWQVVLPTPTLDAGRYSVTVQAGQSARFFRLRSTGPKPASILEASPAHRESGVAVTRETILRFSLPLANDAALLNANFYATFGGRRILARPELAGDRLSATLFYLENLPASAHLKVTFDGNGLHGANGLPLDADGDGVPGGVYTMSFTTLGNTPLANTAVLGRVFASEKNPDGSNQPLANVTVTVDGAEQTLRAVTDTNGFFRLQPAPAGRFFVHIDGRTAVGSQWPTGAYYPSVGKAWDAVAGQTNNLAGGSGEIFLPFIPGDALQTVSLTSDTQVKFSPSVIGTHPTFAQVSITVPANALFSDDGRRGGKVGIAPVPPDRLPGPLPPGLEMPLVITVQTDGGLNFDRPAPICFPNVPDPVLGTPLPAGSQQALISFNHDQGEWEAVGTMTVSADGRLICSDPGSGIRQPGWHGVAPPAITGSFHKGKPPCSAADPGCGCKTDPAELQACFDGVNAQYEECKSAASLFYNQAVTVCDDAFSSGAIDTPTVKACFNAADKAYADKLQQCNIARLRGTKECDQCHGAAGPPQPPPETLPGSASLMNGGEATASARPAGRAVALPAADSSAAIDAALARLSRAISASQALPEAELVARVRAALAEIHAVAGGSLESVLRSDIRQQQVIAEASSYLPRTGGVLPSGAPMKYVAEIHRPSGSLLVRGETKSNATGYQIFEPRDGTLYAIHFLEPATGRSGTVFRSFVSDDGRGLPQLYLNERDGDATDADQDGLPDFEEFVLGTDPSRRDTDGDGVVDGAEVTQGTNPLDGIPMAQGIVATVQTLGVVVDVCAFDDFAVVAEGAAGVSIFDAGDFLNPIRVAQVDTPGNAQAVACAGNLVAVADGSAGLAVIDISDRAASFIARQVPLPGSASAVSVVDGLAYVGLDRGMVAVIEMATGQVLSALNLGLSGLQDVIAVGDAVHALVPPKLFTLSLEGSALALRAETDASPEAMHHVRRLRLTAGQGLLYAATRVGFQAFSLADPFKPALLHDHLTPQSGWRQLVPNGSGLGVGVAGVNSNGDGTDDVYLHDLKPGETNSVFVTLLPTPGLAGALCLHNGLAYVADGGAGLHVLNYLAADTLGVPPAIRLRPSFATNPEPRASSGDRLRVETEVADDVQVRNVEFYLDGTLVAVDGSYPFSLRFDAPLLTPTRQRFTLRARAFDTGGNSAWSDPMTVQLVPDGTRPMAQRLTPIGGTRQASELRAYFSERIAPETLTAQTFAVRGAGPDGLVDTADDVPITPERYSFDEGTRVATAHLAVPLPEGLYRLELTTGITDLAGNALLAGVGGVLRVAAANAWLGGPNGAWNNPANWSDLMVPGPADTVLLDLFPDQPVTWRNANLAVKTLLAFEDLVLRDNSTLVVTDGIRTTGNITLGGGRLAGGRVDMAEGKILTASGGRLENVKLKGVLESTPFAGFTVQGGLDLTEGAVRLSAATMTIADNATISGGEIRMSTGTGVSHIQVGPGATLTLSATTLLHGAGFISGEGTLVNEGVLRADLLNQSISIRPTTFLHRGQARVANGGILSVNGNWGGGGVIDAEGGTLELGGTFTPGAADIRNSGNGTVHVTGTVDLSSQPLVLNANTGPWTISGTLRGGAVNLHDGLVLTARGATLEDITLRGVLEGAPFSGFVVRGGLDLTEGAVRLTSSSMTIADNLTITGGEIRMSTGTGVSHIHVAPDATLTLSATTLLHGAGSIQGEGTLINQGTLRADLLDQGLSIRATTFLHHGEARVANGGILSVNGSWSGGGLIDAGGGTVELGGTFTPDAAELRNSGNGAVRVTGTMDLSGQPLVLNTGFGPWTITGTLRGGTVDVRDGGVLALRGATLEDVKLKGVLEGVPFSGFVVRGGLDLTEGALRLSSSSMAVEGDVTITGGDIQMGRIELRPGATLTSGAATLIHGAGTLQGEGTFINEGTLRADVSGQTLHVQPMTFLNRGRLEQTNGGTLVAPGFP